MVTFDILSVDDIRGSEEYNNPVYSNDLRDHIDRRNSVVEVSWSQSLDVLAILSYFLVSGADIEQPGLTVERADQPGSALTSCLAVYSCHNHSQESRAGNNNQQSVSF